MTFATYNLGIPNGPNNPSADQPLMQTNTNSISSLVSIDHFGFNNPSGGWHKQSTYPNLLVAPTTAAGQVALYSKLGAVTSELFMIRDNNAGTEVALTTSKIGAPSASGNGISWLPGGILIQWGTVTPVANQTLTAVGLSFPNNCFVVVVTEKRTASPNGVDQVYINAKAAGSFSYYATTSGAGFASFDWIAIGN